MGDCLALWRWLLSHLLLKRLDLLMLRDASTEYALSKILVDCLAPSIRVAKGVINLDSERSDKSAGFQSQERAFLRELASPCFQMESVNVLYPSGRRQDVGLLRWCLIKSQWR